MKPIHRWFPVSVVRRWLIRGLLAAPVLLASSTTRALPDLAMVDVDAAGVSHDCQDATVAGSLEVTLRNAGPDAATVATRLIAFDDIDGSRLYEPTVDVALGTVQVPACASGALVTVTVPLAGTLRFAGAPIALLADTQRVLQEEDERNNFGSTAFTSELEGPLDPPVLGTPRNDLSDLMAATTPYLVHLTDDNLDGLFDARDRPTYLIVTSLSALIAVRADTGDLLWTTGEGIVPSLAEVACANLDAELAPEIVVPMLNNYGLMVFSHEGDLEWQTPAWNGRWLPGGAGRGGVLSIADLDGFGTPEIICGASVFSSRGILLADGRDLGGTTGESWQNVNSCVADVDVDGQLDIVAGGTIYSWTAAGGLVIEDQVADVCAV